MKYLAPVLASLCGGLLALGCGRDPVEPNRPGAGDEKPELLVAPGTISINGQYHYAIGQCANWSSFTSGWTFPPTISWSSGNALVASASATGVNGATGRVCGLRDGFSSIQGVADGGSQGNIASQSVDIEVGQPVRSVLIQPSPISVRMGATTQLTFAAVDQYGTRSTRFTPAWASLNSAIATVSATGLVTGKGVGQTSIRASINGITGSATVTVGVASVTISGPGQIFLNGKYTWTAVVNPSGTYNYTWRVLSHGTGATTVYTGNPLTLPVTATTGSLTLNVILAANGLSLGQSGSKVVVNSIAGACGGRKCP
jgi:Bacterial Ig-like domain (group 2)